MPTAPTRTVYLVAFLWGLQFSFLNPALALLLVATFGASTGQVAIVLVIYNSSCLITSWAIPRWADRRGEYLLPMTGCAVFTVLLAVALYFTHHLPLAVVGLVLLGAPAAVGTPLLFGFVKHAGGPPREVVRTRAAFSTAWVAGPPAASAIISLAGGHALVLGIGIVGAVNIAAISTLRRGFRRSLTVTSGESVAVAPTTVATSTIALLMVLFALLQASNSTSTSITTLFATQTLHLSPLWGGVALAVAAGLEVPTLLLLGRGNRRLGDLALLAVACALGAAYFVAMSLTPNGIVLIAAQVLNAAYYGLVAGVGITLFQSVVGAPGKAAGLLSNAQRVGGLLTGPIVAVGSVAPGHLRAVFVACAALCALALLLARVVAPRVVAA